MGNEHIGQAAFFLKIHQQVKDLRLNGHVQRRHRLIADDEGIQRQRTRYADALTASAVQLMGICSGQAGGQSHCVHQPCHLFIKVCLIFVLTRYQKRLGDQLLHTHTGVQAGIGILKDHLHIAAHLGQLVGTAMADVFSVKEDRAGGRFVKPQHGASQGGLSAAGFAHHA